MPTGSEALDQQSQQRSALDAGIEQISAKQSVAFRRYALVRLQQDGFVFWVATGEQMNAEGSLHYATDRLQAEDETIGANQFLFNCETEIAQFNLISPSSMWIGTWQISEGPPLRVAFAQRGNFFREASLWHYSGFAVYPALQTQIIDSPADIPPGPIVSNSLPIWLAQTEFAGQTVPVYPSFLVPDNLVPPYIVAHVAPEQTQALGAFPVIGPWPGMVEPDTGASPLHAMGSSQLMRDEVTLTLYGFSNQMAIQYLAELIEASIDGSAPFGFANSPAIRDEKRPQAEIAAIAQKKTIEISANYLQSTADAVARRLILSAAVSNIALVGGVPTQGVAVPVQDDQVVTAEGNVFE